jgi:hypothetical protein
MKCFCQHARITLEHLSLVVIKSVSELYTHVTILGYPIALITLTLIVLFVRNVEIFQITKDCEEKYREFKNILFVKMKFSKLII